MTWAELIPAMAYLPYIALKGKNCRASLNRWNETKPVHSEHYEPFRDHDGQAQGSRILGLACQKLELFDKECFQPCLQKFHLDQQSDQWPPLLQGNVYLTIGFPIRPKSNTAGE
jgi:hypothetical protein